MENRYRTQAGTEYGWNDLEAFTTRGAFFGFITKLVSQALPSTSERIGVVDAIFMSKSGKHTEGLAWFHSGSKGSAERGLEIHSLASFALMPTCNGLVREFIPAREDRRNMMVR